MVEPRLPLHIRRDLKGFLERIQDADIPQEAKRHLLLVWAKARDDIKKVENKHNG